MRTARQAQYVAGTLAVAVMIAGGKWGSHIRVPPVFIADVLVAAGFAHLFMRRLYSVPDFLPKPPGYDNLKYLVWLGLYTMLRVAFSPNINIGGLRDAAPYIYAAVGLLAGATVMDRAAREKSFKLFAIVLFFHAVWVGAVTLKPSLLFVSVISATPIFYVRPDYDYPMVAVLMALLLYRFATDDRHRMILLGVMALCSIPLLNPHGMNRAGFLGSFAVLGAAVFIIMTSPIRQKSLTYMFAALIPSGILITIPAAESTKVGKRLLETFNSENSTDGQGGYGTMQARLDAWKTLLGWVTDDPGRAVYGAGFGDNIMNTSGANVSLNVATTAGDDAVRAPHNFWINTYAHMGVPGLLFVVIPVVIFARSSWRNRRNIGDDWFKLFVFLVPIALFVPASLGVVLEAPFGAIPFWWCIGAVIAIDYRPPKRDGPDRQRGAPDFESDAALDESEDLDGSRRVDSVTRP